MDCTSCKSTHNAKGEEIPDPTPIEMPLGYERPESLAEMIARMVQSHEFAKNDEIDSEEEANDFDVMDEDVVVSGHEYTDMHEEFIRTEDKNIQTKQTEAAPAASVDVDDAESPAPKEKRRKRPSHEDEQQLPDTTERSSRS